MYSIQIENVSKTYNGKKVLSNIRFCVKKGELLVIVGPSGSGKTTLLKAIASLLEYEGTIEKKGKVSFVFQDAKLFPHLSAYENIAMGTDFKKAKKEDIEALAQMLKIKDCLERKPKELSGGQAQRVSIARALLEQRSILLMDEPFSSLDPILKEELLEEIQSLHKQLKNTLIYVTHNQEEALRLADRIVVLKDGMLQQIGTPEEIWNAPKNPFVSQFVSNMNVIDDFAIHSKDILLDSQGELVKVENIEFLGSYKRIYGIVQNQKIKIDVDVNTEIADVIFVTFPEEKKYVFKGEKNEI
ncbi:MAG: ABC transporter ATP-binding protein [Bacillota bacterium]|nr:ABC transporter ATP-binding protein [Bacillota bacterium]